MNAANRLLGNNVSEYAHVPPAAVHEPGTAEEVRELLTSRSDRSFRTISTGYNWGLGSASSTAPGTDLISLRRLDRIRGVDADLGYAVIEAGVTQEQLVRALDGTGRFLNCTASSARSSVVGNMMDRGVGLHGQRTHDLLGLEIVLPDGTTGTVGWWPGAGSLAANPWGLGPSALHLFTQSNFAVVTAAAVRLRPRPSRREVVTFTVDPDAMRTVVDRLRSLVRDSVLSGVTKIYDQESSSLYGAREARIAVHACIDGAKPIAEAKIGQLMDALSDVGIEFVALETVAQDPLMSAVVGLYDGDTSGSETIVRNALDAATEDADVNGRGWIFLLPFVPMRGADVERAISIVRAGVANRSTRAGTTVNVLDHDTVDLVVALSFDRDEIGTRDAHAALDQIAAELVAAGYAPYRVDTHHRREDYADGGRSIDDRIAQLVKGALDPDEILAPTRYVAPRIAQRSNGVAAS